MNHLGLHLSKHRSVLAALLLITLALTTGCGSEVAPLTEEDLKNAEYQGIFQDPVMLTNGKYEGEPFVEGAASRSVVVFVEPCAFGDLDGDGVDDAAVLLGVNMGGSGSFTYLAAVVNQDGEPANTATALLGDRVVVGELTIEPGGICVEMMSHGPDDPMCCPTQGSEVTYDLKGSTLVLQGG